MARTATADYARATASDGPHLASIQEPTPFLLIEEDVLEANLLAAAMLARKLETNLRPHFKAHKCPEILRRQIGHGAIGATVATADEALVVAEEVGCEVLIANQLAEENARRVALSSASPDTSPIFSVDSSQGVEQLSGIATNADRRLSVAVEVDIGLGRGGLHDPASVVDLVAKIESMSGLSFEGLNAYEGHCSDLPDRDERATAVAEAMNSLETAIDGLRRAGVSCRLVSAGGTGTFEITGGIPFVTEIQAGSYAIMDEYHSSFEPTFAQALHVVATVISRTGPLAIVDAGRKSIGVNLASPAASGYETVFVHEEHLGIADPDERLAIGSRVAIKPGEAPTTINQFPYLNVRMRDGAISRWDVIGRHGGR